MKKSLQVKIPGSNNKNVRYRLHPMRTVSHLEILRLENVRAQSVEVGDHFPRVQTGFIKTRCRDMICGCSK